MNDQETMIKIAGVELPEWKLKRALIILQFLVVIVALTANSKIIIKK